MPVVRTFSTRVSLQSIYLVFNSIGAHVAAKLSQFGTDERTLTDDLCDMFYIWCDRAQGGRSPSWNSSADDPENAIVRSLPVKPFDVTITKSTQQEEATIGNDLALRIETPLGVKRALMQAKVYDPQEDRLRCASRDGWDNLWAQLVLMRQWSDIAFLLIYVPAAKLNAARQGVSTWEQGYWTEGGSTRSSKFGATLISVNDLLSSRNDWQFSPPVSHLGDGEFLPGGISFSGLLIDLLLCRRGQWRPRSNYPPDGSGPISPDHKQGYPVGYTPYREIAITFEGITPDEWQDFVDELGQVVDAGDVK